MNRLLLMPLLLVIACLMAGAYGAAHNQVSYSVSPEYFTKLKFQQFQIPHFQRNRMGAAVVGWRASWWMGIVIGAILVPFGLIIRGTREYFFGMLRVFAAVVLTTMVTGLCALAISFVLIRSESVGQMAISETTIDDSAAFLRAGTMHNFSYLGGLLGILVGGFAIVRDFRRQRTNSDVVTIELDSSDCSRERIE